MTGVLNAIQERITSRGFLDKPVEQEKIDKILEAAIHAPSACDVQGWKFIIIDDLETRKKIVEKGAATFLAKAPLCIMVAYDNRSDNLEYMDYVQSSSAAIQNMLLAGTDLGLGGCWICHLPRKKDVRKILNMPGHYDPIAMVIMGYPRVKMRKRPRKHDLKNMVYLNKFVTSEKYSLWSRFKLFSKRIGRRVYFIIPFRKHIKKYVDMIFEKKFD